MLFSWNYILFILGYLYYKSVKKFRLIMILIKQVRFFCSLDRQIKTLFRVSVDDIECGDFESLSSARIYARGIRAGAFPFGTEFDIIEKVV